jgi:hypothetical protein
MSGLDRTFVAALYEYGEVAVTTYIQMVASVIRLMEGQPRGGGRLSRVPLVGTKVVRVRTT